MENRSKQYYGIKEVADRFQINPSKLRFYESKFPTLQPKKNRSGDRVYTQADIDHLTEILDLINNQKFTLSGAREFLETRDARQRANARMASKLKDLKAFLEQMRSDLDNA